MTRRKSHSRPERCIQRGAWRTIPLWKSNAAPTPIKTGASRSGRIFAIQRSCFVELIPTQMMSGWVALMAAAVSGDASWSSGANGGSIVPATSSPGNLSRIAVASRALTPRPPP